MFFAATEVFNITNVIKGAGLLIWPLALCSAVMVFIVCERAYALRKAAIMPPDLVDAVVNNRPLLGGKHTVLARIVEFAEQHKNDEGAVKAFARLEVNRMERGIPYLDVIYAAAPLIGVPEGTAGKVSTVNGFRWRRYWVSFENGVDIGSLDGAQLTRVNKKGVPV